MIHWKVPNGMSNNVTCHASCHTSCHARSRVRTTPRKPLHTSVLFWPRFAPFWGPQFLDNGRRSSVEVLFAQDLNEWLLCPVPGFSETWPVHGAVGDLNLTPDSFFCPLVGNYVRGKRKDMLTPFTPEFKRHILHSPNVFRGSDWLVLYWSFSH